jgi:hypothetical protein
MIVAHAFARNPLMRAIALLSFFHFAGHGLLDARVLDVRLLGAR